MPHSAKSAVCWLPKSFSDHVECPEPIWSAWCQPTQGRVLLRGGSGINAVRGNDADLSALGTSASTKCLQEE